MYMCIKIVTHLMAEEGVKEGRGEREWAVVGQAAGRGSRRW